MEKIKIIDVRKERYSGVDDTFKKINSINIQFKYKEEILKIVCNNRNTSVYIFNSEKKWTSLNEFEDFRYKYDNLAENFLKVVIKYLSNFFDEKEITFKPLLQL